MRSISRVADVSISTVGKMLVDAGTVCGCAPQDAAGHTSHGGRVDGQAHGLRGHRGVDGRLGGRPKKRGQEETASNFKLRHYLLRLTSSLFVLMMSSSIQSRRSDQGSDLS